MLLRDWQCMEEGIENNALDYIIICRIFSMKVLIFRKLIRLSCFVQRNLRLYLFNSLGRGLRKAEDKEYVVILDFIGNYQ